MILVLCFLRAYVKADFLGLDSVCSSVFPFAENSQLHIYTSSFSCQGAPPFSGCWPWLSSLPPIPHPQLCRFPLCFSLYSACHPPPSQGPTTVSLFITVELIALMLVFFSNLSDIWAQLSVAVGRDDGREGAGGGFSEVKRFLNYWMTFGSEIKQMLLLASQRCVLLCEGSHWCERPCNDRVGRESGSELPASWCCCSGRLVLFSWIGANFGWIMR